MLTRPKPRCLSREIPGLQVELEMPLLSLAEVPQILSDHGKMGTLAERVPSGNGDRREHPHDQRDKQQLDEREAGPRTGRVGWISNRLKSCLHRHLSSAPEAVPRERYRSEAFPNQDQEAGQLSIQVPSSTASPPPSDCMANEIAHEPY